MEGTLKYLNRDDIRLLQPKMRLARAKLDQQLVKEGVLPLGLFIVRSGKVEVCRRMGMIDVPVVELGQGDMFGETAFLQKLPASASVFARSEADLIIFTPDRLEPLFDEHPGLFARFFQSIALVLSRRLRAFNGQVGGDHSSSSQFEDIPKWEIV